MVSYIGTHMMTRKPVTTQRRPLATSVRLEGLAGVTVQD